MPLTNTHTRVKSGIFGQTAKFGQPPCLFHSSVIGMKNKLTKQTVKLLMRRQPSHLEFHCLQMCVRIYLMSELTELYPNTFTGSYELLISSERKSSCVISLYLLPHGLNSYV